jgi:hypothetical protein
VGGASRGAGRDGTWQRGQAPPRFAGSATVTVGIQHRAARHSVGDQYEVTKKRGQEAGKDVKVAETEANMRSECEVKRVELGLRRAVGIGMAGVIVGALTLVPLSAAANGREENLISNERPINRAKVENLQRWVSAGHADWCKDARQVAAEELWRLAADYSGDEFEMNEVKADAILNGGNRVTFEWAPLDGRALYRVTVQRFDWLLPIAKNTESIVWVPTRIEISANE